MCPREYFAISLWPKETDHAVYKVDFWLTLPLVEAPPLPGIYGFLKLYLDSRAEEEGRIVIKEKNRQALSMMERYRHSSGANFYRMLKWVHHNLAHLIEVSSYTNTSEKYEPVSHRLNFPYASEHSQKQKTEKSFLNVLEEIVSTESQGKNLPNSA